MNKKYLLAFPLLILPAVLIGSSSEGSASFPLPLEAYNDGNLTSLWDILMYRIDVHPFNLIATIIFFCAIIHAFMSGKIMTIAHRLKHEHEQKVKAHKLPENSVSMKAEVLHFFGEVEAVFGIWVIPLTFMFVYFEDWQTFVSYSSSVNYTEPMFVVVIMALASTEPIMKYAEMSINGLSSLFGGSVQATWFCVLTLAPLIGSFITEPAAMTIAALLLSHSFYKYRPSKILAYATLGLLFVNISIGGTLTNFAAPPVLMVAEAWQWSSAFMMKNIGWKALLAIITSNIIYMVIFRNELVNLNKQKLFVQKKHPATAKGQLKIPVWIFISHLVFMLWVVINAHHPVLFIVGFLFFLAFSQATVEYQLPLKLRGPLLVGFFLAGLVTHGGLQTWWIAPTLSSLSELPLFIGSIVLTAFNDNAAITYLATLVPDFSDTMKYAVVTGAVAGGGLTVLANAPNPAGQSILSKDFKFNINPIYLFLGALFPTIVSGLFFYFLPSF